jgi:hypothetical protein
LNTSGKISLDEAIYQTVDSTFCECDAHGRAKANTLHHGAEAERGFERKDSRDVWEQLWLSLSIFVIPFHSASAKVGLYM